MGRTRTRLVAKQPTLGAVLSRCCLRVQVGQLATRIIADSGLAVWAQALVLGDRGAAEDGRVVGPVEREMCALTACLGDIPLVCLRAAGGIGSSLC